MNTSMPSATPRRLRTVRAITALALAAALGGCATYDYVGSDAPGGYYRGQSSSVLSGLLRRLPGWLLRRLLRLPGRLRARLLLRRRVLLRRPSLLPPATAASSAAPPERRPRRQPPSGNPGGGNRMPSPWRDLDRIGERQQQRRGNDGPPPRPYGVPQGQPAPQPSMRPPQSSGATPARNQPSRPAILPGFHRPKERRQEQ